MLADRNQPMKVSMGQSSFLKSKDFALIQISKPVER
jgi:hypothetical protein